MHKFWYNSPIKFYSVNNEHYDVLNAQNIQTISRSKPYVLEVNKVHRIIIPDVVLIDGAYKLLVSNNGIKKEIPCKIIKSGNDSALLTFKSDIVISGQLILNIDGVDFMYSNCISFEDTENSYGAKQLRLITRHSYNRQKFSYTDTENSYFAINIPGYEKGIYGLEADISNERVGELSTLETTETYLDEFIVYEFEVGGNNDIALFLASMTTNDELYINGTKRTLKEAIEFDENNIIATATFINQKDKYGNNITIDEDVIFSDIKLSVTSYYPNIGDLINIDSFNANGSPIVIYFNTNIKFNPSSNGYVNIYKNNVLDLVRSKSKMYISGNRLNIYGHIQDHTFTAGDYFITIDDGLIVSDFGYNMDGILNIPHRWHFKLTNTENIAMVSFSDDTRDDKSGNDNVQGVKIDSITNEANVLSKNWVRNNIDLGDYDAMDIPLVSGVNTIKLKVNYTDGVVYSNELIYNKQIVNPLILIDVIRLNNNKAKVVWNNNNNDFGINGSITAQMSIDNGNTWSNVAVFSSGHISNNNEYEVTSNVLTQILNNTNVMFRILANGNNFIDYPSNVVNKLWNAVSRLYITDVVRSKGRTNYKLHVEDSDFNGFLCYYVRGNNIFMYSTIFLPFDKPMTYTLPNGDYSTYEYFTIPIGVYNSRIMVNAEPNDPFIDMDILAKIGYSLSPNMDASIITIDAYNNKIANQ